MKNTLNRGKIAGINVSIHGSFIILLAWIFFSNYRSGGDLNDIYTSILGISSVFLCVLLHEFGHA